MKRENRYLVFKLKDMGLVLNDTEHEILHMLHEKIARARETVNRPPSNCVVVEEDWPMYKSTWKAIEAWVNSEVK